MEEQLGMSCNMTFPIFSSGTVREMVERKEADVPIAALGSEPAIIPQM